MTVLSKPLGKKRALLIAIQHVVSEIGTELDGLSDLIFAHQDVEAVRDFLIAAHGYQQDDIILMKDDIDHPKHLWPTRGRILRQIDNLTRNVPEGCHFFFYYSGHGIEEDCHEQPSTRADGQDDEIVSADGKKILDHDLHKHLIEPLQKINGAKLFALLDCCHSETLLDLQVGNGPNQYGRLWKIGRDELFKGIASAIVVLLELEHRKGGYITPRQTNIVENLSSPVVARVEGLSVICLSACRDKQFAHDVRGLTFTKCFLEAARDNPNMTWVELRSAVRSEFISKIQTTYETLRKPCLQDPRVSLSGRVILSDPVAF